MKKPRLNAITLKWFTPLLFTILLFQNCNTHVDPSPNNAITTQARNAKIAATVQGLSSFKELMKLHEEHYSLYKSKRVKFKKIRVGRYDDCRERLGKVKTKEELIEAFSLISDNPEEVLNFLGKSLTHMSNMKKQLALSGLEEKSINSTVALALTDWHEKQKARAKSLKLDCQGACNNGLNISLGAAASSYNWTLAGCALAGSVGYGSAILSGPVAPATIAGIAIAELICVSAAYVNYTISFDAAILNFDTCWMACAS
jgi:hypothetical protein